jgi:hypothetical protein
MNKTKPLNILSVLSYPTFVALPLVIAFSWLSLLNMIIGIIFISLLPTFLAYVHIRKHSLDFDISDHKQRGKPFVYALLSYAIAAIIFYVMHSQIMFVLSLVYFVVALAIALISTRWKISVHCAGIAGAITDVVYVFGIALLPLFALVIVVAWIRLELKAHNIWQVVAGALVSIMLSLCVWIVLYPVW